MLIRPIHILCLATLLALGGCSSSRNVTFTQWQKDLDMYAHDEMAGDMIFLRETPKRGVYPQFAALGARDPHKSTDVVGVFLGRHSLAGGDWLVFLAGRTVRGSLEDVRIAIRSDDERRRWVMSEPNATALRQYRAYHGWTNQPTAGNRSAPTPPAGPFPDESDVFKAQISADAVSIREENSGAMWTLGLSHASGKGK